MQAAHGPAVRRAVHPGLRLLRGPRGLYQDVGQARPQQATVTQRGSLHVTLAAAATWAAIFARADVSQGLRVPAGVPACTRRCEPGA